MIIIFMRRKTYNKNSLVRDCLMTGIRMCGLPERIVLCLLLFSMNIAPLRAQDTIYDHGDFDPELYNGKVYRYSAYEVRGHQFLEHPDFHIGYLSIGKTTYDSLLLNFDIYNQELLFKNKYGYQGRVISIPMMTINSFSLDHRNFLVKKNDEAAARIFEYIGNSEVRFLREWKKDIKVISGSGAYQHEFSRKVMLLYLETEGMLCRVKKRRELIRCYPDSKQPEIKKYLRVNRIRMGRVDNNGLEKLALYLKSISN